MRIRYEGFCDHAEGITGKTGLAEGNYKAPFCVHNMTHVVCRQGMHVKDLQRATEGPTV